MPFSQLFFFLCVYASSVLYYYFFRLQIFVWFPGFFFRELTMVIKHAVCNVAPEYSSFTSEDLNLIYFRKQ